MVQTLQSIKGGGGSIKVGATGTISSLMMRELESPKSSSKKPVTSKNKSLTTTYTMPSASSVPKRPQQRKSFDEASNSRSWNSVHSRSLGNSRNTKVNSRNVQRMPMLDSNNICTEENSCRKKPERIGLRAVAIVDVKCNNPDRAWASRPISNRLRKLGFSKLSETFA